MDEQLVLTAQTLRLNPDIKRADAGGDVFILKNVPARRYLTVSVAQWNLLLNFVNPATVPDVLRAVILNRTCLPLREYYELILKAESAGILRAERATDTEVRARRWPISLPPWVSIILAVLATLCAAFFLFTQPFPWPGHFPHPALLHLFIGWLLLSAGLSLGQVLAASVLRAGGGEVYDPEFRLLRPVPYFGVALGDAKMTSVLTQCGVWCARLFPVIATGAYFFYARPEWSFIHLLGIVVMLRPVGGGCMSELISTLCRGTILDTQRDFIFSLNRRWSVRLKFSLARLSWPYLLARLAWGVVWTVFVVFLALRAANMTLHDVFGNVAYWREVSIFFGGATCLVLAAYIGLPIWRSIAIRVRTHYARFRTLWRRWHVTPDEVGGDEQVMRVLSDSLLFRRLPPAARTELRQCGQLKAFKGMKTIQRFGEESDQVGVIISGRVCLFRRVKSGRAEKVTDLVESDVFGCHGMLDPERQNIELRSQTPVVALMIPVAEFEARVLKPMGTALLNDYLHKVPFLRGVSFCESWHPQAVARFARLSATVTYHEDEVVVSDRQDTQQFYLVYEGRVSVQRRNKVKAKLKPGAFFGEVSILQNSASMNDVVARESTRCLLISKSDFLRFLTHNPLVGLQLEQISSERLGRPIFPLSEGSFDVH